MMNFTKMLRFATLPLVFCASLSAMAQTPAAPSADLPKAAFTDSTAAGLAATKRVAITNVTIAFQSSTGAMAGPGLFFRAFQPKDEVLTVLALPNMNPGLQDALADAAYNQLRNELTAAGFEVLPEEQVTASANYKAILGQAGYANHSRFANAMGDISLVSAAGLQPYLSYAGELGTFYSPTRSYLGWVTGFGQNSPTPGGPSFIKSSNAWKVPGMEVALAKELNAHVVKAYYVITLGKAEARRKTDYSTSQHSGIFMYKGDLYSGNYSTIDRTITGTGKAFAEIGMVAEQTRISFRSPTGNAKWQKVSMFKTAAAKDGDVVVRLDEPLVGDTAFFDVQQGQLGRNGGFFSQQKRGDINLAFIASVSNEPGYGREVTGMIGSANKAMIALVKP